jgi:hypothetical protein
VAVLDVKVVVGSEHIAGYDGGEHGSMLRGVAAVHYVDHALGVAVAKVAVVRGAVVNHGLVDGVRRLQNNNNCTACSQYRIIVYYFTPGRGICTWRGTRRPS